MAALLSGTPFEKVDIRYRLVDQLAQRNECIAGPKGRATREVWPSRRKLRSQCCNYARPALPCADLGDATTIYAEVSGDIVLPITTGKHSLHNRNFLIVERHRLYSVSGSNRQDGISNPRLPEALA